MTFDDTAGAALARVLADIRGQLEAELRAYTDALAAAAAAERAQAAESAAADVRRQAQAQLSQLRDAARQQTDDLRRAAEAQVAEWKRTVDELRQSHQQELEAARTKAAADVEDAHRIAQAQVEDVQRTYEELVIAQLAAAHADHERRLDEALDRARTDAHQAELAHAVRLVDAFRTIDEARTLGEVLDALAQSAGREAERAAVLVVKGERLQGWRWFGFNGAAPPKSVLLPLDEAGLPGVVVRTGAPLTRPALLPGDAGDERPPLPPFARQAGARHAIALPLLAGGSAVAVLYADAARVDAPTGASRWPAVLELLARHASRALEAMTMQQAMGMGVPRAVARASHTAVPGPVEHLAGDADEDVARRYARLLLSEVRIFNEPLVDAGRKSRDLLARLGGEIDRARRLYEARVPSTCARRAEFFDQELVRTLADGDRTLLGSLQ